MKTKKCSKCGEHKPVSEFHKEKKSKDGLNTRCATCIAEKNRRLWLRRNYGITVDDYEMLLARQHYSCAICGSPECSSGRRLAVDHCHQTGQVRGLLCMDCNTSLGGFKDDVNRLMLAAQYLTASGEWLPGPTMTSFIPQG